MKFTLRLSLYFVFLTCLALGNSLEAVPYINNQSSLFSENSKNLRTNSAVSFFSSNQYSGTSFEYQVNFMMSPISMFNTKLNLINYSSDGLNPNTLINYDFNIIHKPTDNLYLSIGFKGVVGDQTNFKVKPY